MDFQATGSFQSSDGSSEIAYYMIKPKGKLRAVLQISHGMCEYFRRYDEFAAFMSEQGFAVVGNDHLGHGASAAKQEDLGWFAEKDGWIYLVEDLHRMMELGKQAFPSVPYVLLGHSMGSFLARAFLSQYGAELSGAILCGTGGRQPLVRFALWMSALSTRLHGQRHRPNFMDQLTFGNYCARYEPGAHPQSWITRDQTIVQNYRNDPYCHFTFTSSAFHDLFSMNRHVNSPLWAESIRADIPIFLISGDMDPVGDYGKGVFWVYDQLRKAGKPAEMKLYPEARHELLNETNRQEVYADLLAWLNTRILPEEESS